VNALVYRLTLDASCKIIWREHEWFFCFAPADCGKSRVDVNRRIIQSCPHSRAAASPFLVPACPA
jgi:hypothetical protein